MQVMWSGPGECYAHSGSMSHLKVPKLRNPQSYKRLPNLRPRERHYVYYPDQETDLPLPLSWRHYLCIPRLFAMQTSLKTPSRTKAVTRYIEAAWRILSQQHALYHHHTSPAGLSSTVLTHLIIFPWLASFSSVFFLHSQNCFLSSHPK